MFEPGREFAAIGAFGGEAREQSQPPLLPSWPVEIGPEGELLLCLYQGCPAPAMQKNKRSCESRSVLTAGTFHQKGTRHRIKGFDKFDKHSPRGELAGIEFHIAMHDVEFSADARFVFPPEMTGVASAKIDDSPYLVRTQKQRQKPGVCLRRPRSLARLYPVKVVRKIKKHKEFSRAGAGIRRQTRLPQRRNAGSPQQARNHAKWPCGTEAFPPDKRSRPPNR